MQLISTAIELMTLFPGTIWHVSSRALPNAKQPWHDVDVTSLERVQLYCREEVHRSTDTL